MNTGGAAAQVQMAQDQLDGHAGHGGPPIRVLGPHERGRFAADAWGHLLGLARSGVLDPAELELVIDRAMIHIDGVVSLAELRSLMGDYRDEGSDGYPTSITVH